MTKRFSGVPALASSFGTWADSPAGQRAAAIEKSLQTLYVNGKFLCQRTTGVQRVAGSLLRALDRRLALGERHRFDQAVLLLPPGASAPRLRSISTRVVGPGRLPLHLWEQGPLAWAARQGRLLNLSGSAPMFAARQACLLHDAAVFDRPQAYSAAFVRWYRLLFWTLPRLGARLMTVSDFSRARLASRLGVAAASIAVVPNGADHLASVMPDIDVLSRHGLVPGRYFLAVGSASANKNAQALRAAFAGLASAADFRLVFVGGADARVFGKAPELLAGADERVLQTGPIDDAALKALYQHATALVFPSLYEGFGLPPLEAMACACPVLASDAAAVPEVCGEAALYFDPASVAQIRAAMARLLDEPALREHLIRAGTQRVQHFDWDRSAQALLALIETGWDREGAAP